MTTPTPQDRVSAPPNLLRPAASARERGCTLALAFVMLVQLMACGSKPKTSRYQQAVTKQQACCNGLQDPQARQSCEQSIVKLKGVGSEDSEVNQATFRCVETHFVCDAATGKATTQANQSTLDCLTDLSE